MVAQTGGGPAPPC